MYVIRNEADRKAYMASIAPVYASAKTINRICIAFYLLSILPAFLVGMLLAAM